jgi:hypothetical protein
MKTITKYIADDGKEFTNQEECKDYEKNRWFIELWEKEDKTDWGAVYWHDEVDIFDGAVVLEYLSKHCIITKKPETPSAKKVLNKGKNN